MKAILNGNEDFILDEGATKASLNSVGKGKFIHIIHNNKSVACEIIKLSPEEKLATLLVNGKEISVKIEDELDALLKTMGITTGQSNKIKQLKSPMPGLVLSINCKDGQHVMKDDVLLILEAMKMENAIKSPQEGVVKSIHVSPGNAIEKGVVMITFE
ncbi:MAG: acetyl-CoA carboxylase biotin carboxyl carrier protein subunit [Bacteroidota bacterium]|jgi:biotin carboxyl carrier protein